MLFRSADLAGLAQAKPGTLQQICVDLGDGTYAVRFNRNGVTSIVRVDADLSGSFARIGADGNIWAPVIEKAYAFFRKGTNTYDCLNYGDPESVFSDLGFAYNYAFAGTFDAAGLYNFVQNAVAQHQTIVLPTTSLIQRNAPLIGDHAYTVIGATQLTDGSYLFTLRNPWGFNSPDDGVVQLTFTQLTQNTMMGAITR